MKNERKNKGKDERKKCLVFQASKKKGRKKGGKKERKNHVSILADMLRSNAAVICT